MSVKITAENFESEVTRSDVPVLIDFYSDSCIPCKRLSPILAELEEEYAGKFKLCKVNVNVNSELTETHDILSAPTLVVFSGGTEQARTTGFVKKEALIDIINKQWEEEK
jgi:thioredoxin 1